MCKLAGMLDPVTMNLPTRRANMAYLSDAISTIIGGAASAPPAAPLSRLPSVLPPRADAARPSPAASLGTSTIVTYIESGTGVRDGGRTGVVAITTGVLFLLTLPFAPWMAEVGWAGLLSLVPRRFFLGFAATAKGPFAVRAGSGSRVWSRPGHRRRVQPRIARALETRRSAAV